MQLRRFILLLSAIGVSSSNADATLQTESTPGGGPVTSEQIRDVADRVMQQHDFRSVRRRVLENAPPDSANSDGFLVESLRTMGEAVGDFFEWLFSGITPRNRRAPPVQPTTPSSSSTPDSGVSSSGMGEFSVGNIVLYVGLAALILVAIWIIAMVIRSKDGRRRIDSSGLFDDENLLGELNVPPGELAASTYESRAIQMASEGDYRAAIRELLIGSMSWIERAGLIRFRKGLTNRDYMRAVWRQEERRKAYGRTAFEFERVYFGRREATPEMFNECLRQFQGVFREEETTAAV